jgi:hypothetical protein
MVNTRGMRDERGIGRSSCRLVEVIPKACLNLFDNTNLLGSIEKLLTFVREMIAIDMERSLAECFAMTKKPRILPSRVSCWCWLNSSLLL